MANAPATLADHGAGLPAALEREIRSIYERRPPYPHRFPLYSEPLQWSC